MQETQRNRIGEDTAGSRICSTGPLIENCDLADLALTAETHSYCSLIQDLGLHIICTEISATLLLQECSLDVNM